METRDIKDIIEIVGRMGIAHLELEKEDVKLIIKNYVDTTNEIKSEKKIIKEEIEIPKENHREEKVSNDSIMIKSPMVGTFYDSPSPDAKPFVEVGSKVKIGDTFCIIEAMKVMNEITSEFEGKVLEIFVKNGDVVEYGQPLAAIGK